MNNPISFVDVNGMNEEQRNGALLYARSYLNSGSTYDNGSKGIPGKPVDCSGLVNNSVVNGGDEPSLVGRKGVTGTGVQQIEKVSDKIENTNDIVPGNIVTFRYGGSWSPHTGMVTEVNKDDNGNVQSFSYIHSSSSHDGPAISTMKIGNKVINGFYKWDTIPDKTAPKPSENIIRTQKQIDPEGR